MRRLLFASTLLVSLSVHLTPLAAIATDNAPPGPNSADSVEGKVWQAEEWVKSKNSPWLTPEDGETEKKKHKGSVRNFIKAVAKGTAKELGTSAEDFAKDMVLVFSVQDIDPYEQKGVPTKRPAIILKFTMVDGSNAYLRRFPDGSYAIEEGFANGTVLIPRRDKDDYLVKYPNGARGRMVKDNTGTITIYRPDQSVTTVAKTAGGGYKVNNTKFGYMGDARPDSTGINYESGQW
ncbi:hypothetical protein KA183_06065 [bacterium]|nr:hypothetical protein [bacterium]QQR56321.1 MAG: hypothetical protein IPG59_15075 [Candidatus Melainabacteria bacterium]